MTLTEVILKISISLLVGIGLQYFFVGLFTMATLDFYNFNILQWVLEIIYITFLVTLPLAID